MWPFLLFCAFLGLARTGQASEAPPLCQRLHVATSKYHAVYMCLGVPAWALVPALWTPLSIQVNCSAPTYEIFTAATREQLDVAPQAVRWCGFAHFAQPDMCAFTLSPFEDVYVAINTRRQSLLGMVTSGAAAEPQCSFRARRDLSLTKVAMTVLGVALFTNAHTLTMSATFRLGSGALVFASGVVLVLAFVLMRSMPHKKKLAAALMFSGTSLIGFLQWAYGTWSPDLYEIATSRAFIIYAICTGLLGLAVTYWLDDTANVKLNNTVNAVLHLAGLLLVFLGTTSETASLTLMGLLVVSRVLAPVARRVPRAWRWLRDRRAAAYGPQMHAPREEKVEVELTPSPMGGVGPVRGRLGLSPKAEKTHAGANGLLLSDDEEREAEVERRRLRREQEARMLRELELKQQQQQQRGQGLERLPGSLSEWLKPGAGEGQRPQQQMRRDQQQQQDTWEWPSNEAASKPQKPLPMPVRRQQPQQQQQEEGVGEGGVAGGWFGRWGNSRASERAQEQVPTKPLPLHLRTPPPTPAVLRRREQQLKKDQERKAPAGRVLQREQPNGLLYENDEDGSLGDGDEELSEEEVVHRSPWSSEKLVVDIQAGGGARRAAASGRSAGSSGGGVPAATAAAAAPKARSGGTPSRAATAAAAQAATAAAAEAGAGVGGAGGAGGGDVSPLVKMGKIFNTESSRLIQIGKGKYEELLAKGYVADLKNGVLMPPPAPSGSGKASASGTASASSGGAARQRASRRG